MNNDNEHQKPARNNRIVAGFIFLAAGSLFLLKELNLFFFPYWLFSWPMILIAVGVASGVRHNFRKPFSYVLIIAGTLFLLSEIAGFHLSYLFWPLVLIAIGLKMILTKNSHWHNHCHGYRAHWERRMNMPAE